LNVTGQGPTQKKGRRRRMNAVSLGFPYFSNIEEAKAHTCQPNYEEQKETTSEGEEEDDGDDEEEEEDEDDDDYYEEQEEQEEEEEEQQTCQRPCQES